MAYTKRNWRKYLAKRGLSASSTLLPGEIEILQAQEYDTAQVLTVEKNKAINLVGEVNTAQSVSHERSITLTAPVQEVDTALGFASAKDQAVGLAGEVSQALSVSIQTGKTITQVQEVNTTFPLTVEKQTAIGLASEVSVAQSVIATKSVSVGIASEVNSLFSFGKEKALSVGQASEVSSAFAVTSSQSFPMSTAADAFQIVNMLTATATGTQNVSHSLGVAPTFVFGAYNNDTNITDDVGSAHVAMGTFWGSTQGSTDAGTNFQAVYKSEDGRNPNDTGYSFTNSQTIRITNSNHFSPEANAQFITLTTGEAQYEYTNVDANQFPVTNLIMALSSDSQYWQGQINNLAGGLQENLDFGFEPDLVVLNHVHSNSESNNGSHAGWGLGFATSSGNNFSFSMVSPDNIIPSAQACMVSNSFAGLILDRNANPPTHLGNVRIENFNSSGVRVSDLRSTTATETFDYYVMAIRFSTNSNVRAFGTIAATSTGLATYGGLGFQPDLLFGIQTMSTSLDTIHVSTAQASGFGMFFSNGSTNDQAYWIGENHNSTSASDTAAWSREERALYSQVASTLGFSKEYEAQLSSFNSSGFVLNYLSGGSVQRELIAVAISV